MASKVLRLFSATQKQWYYLRRLICVVRGRHAPLPWRWRRLAIFQPPPLPYRTDPPILQLELVLEWTSHCYICGEELLHVARGSQIQPPQRKPVECLYGPDFRAWPAVRWIKDSGVLCALLGHKQGSWLDNCRVSCRQCKKVFIGWGAPSIYQDIPFLLESDLLPVWRRWKKRYGRRVHVE